MRSCIIEYLSVNAKLGHRVYDAQEGWDRLGLLSNLGLMHFELQSVVLEIFLNLLSIDVVDIQVRDCQNTTPSFVALGQLWVFLVEDTVKKGKIVGDLLVAIDVKAIFGHFDSSSKV